MAQDNIYDYTVSELILRLDANTATDSYTANLIINNSLGQDTIEASSSTAGVTFTSTVINFPSGYSVKANTHILTFPNATPPVTTSGSVSSGTTTMILGAIPSTFIVTSAITLEHATSPDIVLAGSQTITAVLPIYYGVKPFEVTPDVTSLEQISSSVTTFDLTSTILGRLNIVIPTSTGTMLSVTDDNGLIIPASDFLKTTILGFDYYVLIYDTQLTGTNLKTFTINYV
jgi:hypothetical protein